MMMVIAGEMAQQLERTGIWFPAPKLDSSNTPDPGSGGGGLTTFGLFKDLNSVKSTYSHIDIYS